MSDGKCKSSYNTPSVVLNATIEQVLIGGRELAIFCLKINSDDFSSVFVRAKRAGTRF